MWFHITTNIFLIISTYYPVPSLCSGSESSPERRNVTSERNISVSEENAADEEGSLFRFHRTFARSATARDVFSLSGRRTKHIQQLRKMPLLTGRSIGSKKDYDITPFGHQYLLVKTTETRKQRTTSVPYDEMVKNFMNMGIQEPVNNDWFSGTLFVNTSGEKTKSKKNSESKNKKKKKKKKKEKKKKNETVKEERKEKMPKDKKEDEE